MATGVKDFLRRNVIANILNDPCASGIPPRIRGDEPSSSSRRIPPHSSRKPSSKQGRSQLRSDRVPVSPSRFPRSLPLFGNHALRGFLIPSSSCRDMTPNVKWFRCLQSMRLFSRARVGDTPSAITRRQEGAFRSKIPLDLQRIGTPDAAPWMARRAGICGIGPESL